MNLMDQGGKRKEVVSRLEVLLGPSRSLEFIRRLSELGDQADTPEDFDKSLAETIGLLAEKFPYVREKFEALVKPFHTPLERLEILKFIVKSLKADIY